MQPAFCVAGGFHGSIIDAMRFPILAIALLGAGCSAATPVEERPRRLALAEQAPTPAPKAEPSGAGEEVFDYEDLERMSGEYVTLEGVFSHIHSQHGVLKLDSGLLVTIPHFDLFRRGVDWLRYVGHRCIASGVLHTWRRPEIEGYRGPTLQVDYFYGPGD